MTNPDNEIKEPPNSTVDDWLGQRVERDADNAERVLEETGDMEQAEEVFDQTAEKHRPEDLPTEERRT